MKRILILCLALVAGSGLLAQDDPLAEAITAGQTTFQTAGGIGCVACHGAYGLGDLNIGPNIRGLDAIRIRGALEAAEEMDFLSSLVSRADIDNLASYLQYLGGLEAVSTQVRAGEFTPAEVVVAAGSEMQLIVNNGNRSECTFSLADVAVDPVVIAGRQAGDLVTTVPDTEGTLVGSCAEAPEATLTVRIEVPASE